MTPPDGEAAPRSDWPLVGLATLLVVAGVGVVSALYGTVLAVVATGGASAVAPGAGLGSLLSFSWLGAAVRASAGGTDHVLAFETRFLPLGGLVVPAAVTWAVLRWCEPRLRRTEALVTFVAKVTAAVAVVTAVLARAAAASGLLASHVDAGPAALFALVVIGLTGAVLLVRQGAVSSGDRRPPGLLLAVLAGARAWALAAVFMTALTAAAAVVAADSGTERALLLLGAPLVGVNVGVQAVSVAMGAGVRLEAVGPAEVGGIPPPGAGHLSLSHFGFPPDADSGAAPAATFLLLAVAPALVAWSVCRELRRRPPRDEQDALTTAFAAAGGFAAAAVAGAAASAVWLLAVASELTRPGGLLVARPSVPGTLGLALVWGVLGSVATALAVTRRRPSR